MVGGLQTRRQGADTEGWFITMATRGSSTHLTRSYEELPYWNVVLTLN